MNSSWSRGPHYVSCEGSPRRRRLGAAALTTLVVVGGLTGDVMGQEPAPIQVLRAEYGDPVLRGIIDLHAHSGPDVRERAITDFDAARVAKRAGMRAIVLKHHASESAHRAQMVMHEVPGIDVYGAVILNLAVGGINPHAIRTMLGMEGNRGKVVWLPTWDAEADASRQRANRPAVPIMRDGELVFAGGTGDADRERGLPATGHTVYPIGSITKLLTAGALVRLESDGILDLDDPIADRVPEFDDRRVTLRMLAGVAVQRK